MFGAYKTGTTYLVAILLMLILISPQSAQASISRWNICGDYEYNTDSDGKAMITRFNGWEETEVAIPSVLDGYPVISLGEGAFQYHENIVSLTLPEGIISIGNYAVYECKNLVSINFPEGLQNIGDNAFHSCESLASVKLPNSLKSIGDGAFSFCGITEVVIPPGILEIGPMAFQYCYNLTKVTFSDGLKKIESELFRNCYALSDVTLPAGLRSIDDFAFASCHYDLQSIYIPASVTEIGNDAFSGCYDVTLKVEKGSYAEAWAKENNKPYKLSSSLNRFTDVNYEELKGEWFKNTYYHDLDSNGKMVSICTWIMEVNEDRPPSPKYGGNVICNTRFEYWNPKTEQWKLHADGVNYYTISTITLFEEGAMIAEAKDTSGWRQEGWCNVVDGNLVIYRNDPERRNVNWDVYTRERRDPKAGFNPGSFLVNASNGLNLREEAFANSKSLKVLANNEQVCALESDGIWTKVLCWENADKAPKSNVLKGYVSSKYLNSHIPPEMEIANITESPQAEEKQPAVTEIIVDEPTKTDDNATQNIKAWVISPDGLYVHKKADNKSDPLITLSLGMEVFVTDKGNDWSSVNWNGEIGYVATEYLTFKDPVGEIQMKTVESRNIFAGVWSGRLGEKGVWCDFLITLENDGTGLVERKFVNDSRNDSLPMPDMSISYRYNDETISFFDRYTSPYSLSPLAPDSKDIYYSPRYTLKGNKLTIFLDTKYTLVLTKKDTVYYLENEIKCLNAWTFTSKKMSQVIPLYTDRKLYDVSIDIPQEASDWLVNNNGNTGKQTGYLVTIVSSENNSITGPYKNSGGFYLSVTENKTGKLRQAEVLIKAKAKDKYGESFTKVILIRQLAKGDEVRDIGVGSIRNPQLPSNTWLWPVPALPVLGQLFGRYNTLEDFHPAIDIPYRSAKGKIPILAAKDGVVVHVVPNGSKGGTACRILIRHIIGSDVYYSLYLHLKNDSIPKNLRKVGTEVKEGDFIGYMGDTGKTNGTHLHYSIFLEVGSKNKTDGKPDPNKHEMPGVVYEMNTQSIFDSRIKPNDVYKNLSYCDEGIYYKLPELK